MLGSSPAQTSPTKSARQRLIDILETAIDETFLVKDDEDEDSTRVRFLLMSVANMIAKDDAVPRVKLSRMTR